VRWFKLGFWNEFLDMETSTLASLSLSFLLMLSLFVASLYKPLLIVFISFFAVGLGLSLYAFFRSKAKALKKVLK